MFRAFLFLTIAISFCAHAESCLDGDDDPALKVKTDSGHSLVVCGFEDHDVKTTEGKRAFADFTVYSVRTKDKKSSKVFESGASETFWIKPVKNKGLELEELWFFSEEPKPALWQEILCDDSGCKLSQAKCVFKMKPNSFPRALSEFEKARKAGDLSDDGEELLDQIWAQALTGDKAAQKFYNGKQTGLDESLMEVFESNKKKLRDLEALKCH